MPDNFSVRSHYNDDMEETSCSAYTNSWVQAYIELMMKSADIAIE